jgi:hypothetical protein
MRLLLKKTAKPAYLALAAAIAFVAGSAAQAEGIGSKFDGRYVGTSKLVAPLSGPGCASAGMRYNLDVRNGRIDGDAFDMSAQDQLPNRVKGIVDPNGFLTGTEEQDKGPNTRFEGRMDGPRMVAGVFTQGYNCAWVVKLKRRGA